MRHTQPATAVKADVCYRGHLSVLFIRPHCYH